MLAEDDELVLDRLHDDPMVPPAFYLVHVGTKGAANAANTDGGGTAAGRSVVVPKRQPLRLEEYTTPAGAIIQKFGHVRIGPGELMPGDRSVWITADSATLEFKVTKPEAGFALCMVDAIERTTMPNLSPQLRRVRGVRGWTLEGLDKTDVHEIARLFEEFDDKLHE